MFLHSPPPNQFRGARRRPGLPKFHNGIRGTSVHPDQSKVARLIAYRCSIPFHSNSLLKRDNSTRGLFIPDVSISILRLCHNFQFSYARVCTERGKRQKCVWDGTRALRLMYILCIKVTFQNAKRKDVLKGGASCKLADDHGGGVLKRDGGGAKGEGEGALNISHARSLCNRPPPRSNRAYLSYQDLLASFFLSANSPTAESGFSGSQAGSHSRYDKSHYIFVLLSAEWNSNLPSNVDEPARDYSNSSAFTRATRAR